MSKVTIVGAGMAGLLAGNMLKDRHSIRVLETQKECPNNHSAVLRFRSSIVGDTLGIPFRKVTMIKTSLPWRNPVADSLAYSRKNSGCARSDRSINAGDLVADRFIAPHDLISRMASRLQIDFGHYWQPSPDNGPVISTLPMPVLMKLLDYPGRTPFYFISGINIRAEMKNTDAYVSVMVPDPEIPFSRVSITGAEMIVEIPEFNVGGFESEQGQLFLGDLALSNAVKAAELLGFPSTDVGHVSVKKQQYAKILPIDDEVRREFIYWATHSKNVYSLGRYATWRSKLLLDDLVQDVKLIDRWLTLNSRYAVARQR
jgi:hypothetical protein